MFIFFTILLIAVGLSMDTFSLSLSYGMLNQNKKAILKISLTVGIFHFFMPLLGEIIGEIVTRNIPIKEDLIIGLVFLILTIELIISLFKKEELKPLNSYIEILIFALTVSIDSFTTGIGLDAIEASPILISSIFFIVSSTFTFLGFYLGYKINDLVGNKAKIIGIILLFFLSINYIIKGC